MSKFFGKGTLSGGIVCLNVGTPETPFEVHLELLCDSSPYFNQLFKDRFASVPPTFVRFPDDDPDTFTEFLNWVYGGTIFQKNLQTPLLELFRLWVLANRFEIPELQNLVMVHCKKRLEDRRIGVPGTELINYVYNNTISGSSLRQLTVDTYSQRETKVRFSSYRETLPRDFLEDLFMSWLERRDDITPGVSLSHDFEARYFVPVGSPPSDNLGRPSSPRGEGVLQIARLATPEQIENRKIKSPASRRRSDRAPSSTGAYTPSTTSTDIEREQEVSQKLKQLEF